MKENKKKLGKAVEGELNEDLIGAVSGGNGAKVTTGLVSTNVSSDIEISPTITTGDIKAQMGLVNLGSNTAKINIKTGGKHNTVQNNGGISIGK